MLSQTLQNQRKVAALIERIQLRGVVQGVGMRPFVFHLAKRYALKGWVNNNSDGVDIIVCGDIENLDLFKKALLNEAPPLSKIENLNVSKVNQEHTFSFSDVFEIRTSQSKALINTTISSDAAYCDACKQEIIDPDHRRYRYPFTNCTHCGPRFSIAFKIPFDRENTSMVDFPMCEFCQREYEDPQNRRFHAQAICCPCCGPELLLVDSLGKPVKLNENEDAIQASARLVNEGKILALKGLGGFHLACKAENKNAIAILRERKSRPTKPFALMALDIKQIQLYAIVNTEAETLLSSAQAPIVLLDKGADKQTYAKLPDNLAPGQGSLGFMLPYTPMHFLLMQDINAPLVMTSGNKFGNPQCIENEDALEKLADVADYFLLHNRKIVHRLDDSVIKQQGSGFSSIRRARAYAPELLPERPDLFQNKTILAMGSEQKNTLCWIKNNRPLLSAHIGDIFQAETFKTYLKNIACYQATFDIKPSLIAVDKHPNYHSTREGLSIAEADNIALVKVQHHHAHIASCLLENNYGINESKVLGLVLDGSGYGDDGSVWGGEFILADYRSAERLGHFQTVPLPGGEQAVLEPWRNAYAHLHGLGWHAVASKFASLKCIQELKLKPLAFIDTLIKKQINSPLTSSAGRVFDAAAALLGICFEKITYEGEAAMQLEALAQNHFFPETTVCYPYGILEDCLIWQPTWMAMLKDISLGVAREQIAARFHNTIASAVSELAIRLCEEKGIKTIALSGGVFQNKFLLQACLFKFEKSNIRILTHKHIPANDGGIALGQAAIAGQRNL